MPGKRFSRLDNPQYFLRDEIVHLALCSDEQGGEHEAMSIRRADLPKLKALDFRRVHGADHYEDGAETWQGPRVNFDEALRLEAKEAK